MSVNSILPRQPVQATEVPKKTDVAAARKQSDIQLANKVDARKQADNNKAQLQSTPEPVKPSVNSNGQKTGSIINVAA